MAEKPVEQRMSYCSKRRTHENVRRDSLFPFVTVRTLEYGENRGKKCNTATFNEIRKVDPDLDKAVGK